MTNANGKVYDHIVTLVLRLFFAAMFLPTGLGKFQSLAGFRESMHKSFDSTFLAGPLLDLFLAVLPFVEVGVGGLLLLGLLTRPVFVVTALTLVALFFGKWVTHDLQTSAFNAVYVFIAVYAVRQSEHNRFSLDALLFRKK